MKKLKFEKEFKILKERGGMSKESVENYAHYWALGVLG